MSNSDALWIAVTADGFLRARIVFLENVVAEAWQRHKPSALSAVAVGRALVGSALFPVSWKHHDRLALQWSGSGPLGSILTEVRAPGTLRGFVRNSQAHVDGYTGVRGVGRGLLPGGYLSMVRQSPDGKFAQSQTSLRNGEIDEDLEYFLLNSDQVPTWMRASVVAPDVMDESAKPVRAWGVMIQTLPGGDPQKLPQLLDVEHLDPNVSAEQILKTILPDEEWQILEMNALHWHCPCSRERAYHGIRLLGAAGVEELLVQDGKAEVKCEFCSTTYAFGAQDLVVILQGLEEEAEQAALAKEAQATAEEDAKKNAKKNEQ